MSDPQPTCSLPGVSIYGCIWFALQTILREKIVRYAVEEPPFGM